MAKRLIDLLGATLGLALLWPVLLVAALGIRISSPGPVVHRARRVGRHGVPFEMYKLRTMRVDPAARPAAAPRVTATDDPRVFPFGALLRRTKIDELPQLLNIVRGEMSIIGPRPEDPWFVDRVYDAAHRETLTVRPGLSSPGSLYHDSHGDDILGPDTPEAPYVERLLPLKLALDAVYVRRASIAYDVQLIARTIYQVGARVLGRRHFAEPWEMDEVRAVRPELLPEHLRHGPRTRSGPPGAPWRRRTGRHATPRRLGGALVLVVSLATCGSSESTEPLPYWLYDPSEVILVGAGDIGDCTTSADDSTAALLDVIPGTIFTAGDNAYPDGTLAEFVECYGPSWGRHKDRTHPSPGNHDYRTAEGAGYFAYFGAQAGPAGLGYYSYDRGAWHIVALNSEIAFGAGSEQLVWLAADLADAAALCVLAYWHRPLFSSGRTHGGSSTARAAWDVLYAAGADVVIGGHEHLYERFAPQTPSGALDATHGIRQFIVGTGGASNYDFADAAPQSERRIADSPGVLAFRLLPDAYEWQFVTAAGAADTGRGTCHGAPEAEPRQRPGEP